jgi:ubiquinone/menaquinone biosynthesis C-methylase UbiE
MGWWGRHVVPRIVNKNRSPEVARLRARVCAGLAGDVIEVGFGSGLNVAHYPEAVRGVWAVEPSDVAWKMAQPRIAAGPVPVHRAGLDGQHLSMSDERYDTALSTFTMCTIPDLDAALAELRRVLRPGGTLHFVEHGRSPDARISRWQDRLQPINGRLAGGCHLDRPIADHIRASGWTIEQLDRFYLVKPSPFTYAFLGTARNAT